ncbi:MAG: YybS family protein [Gemmatimonadaceae bacterium]|nr:YybS family protein [Gemmatimonadaceae bacterium]
MTAATEERLDAHTMREHGWRRLVLAVAAAAAVSVVSTWPPSLALIALGVHWLLPIASFGALVLMAVAACAVAAWGRGGRVLPALLAIVAVSLWLWRGAPAGPMGALTTGWSLLVAAAFGVMCLREGPVSFVQRALPAVALAAGLGLVGVVWASTGKPDGLGGVARAYEQSFVAKRDGLLTAWTARRSAPDWRAVVERVPAVGEVADRSAAGLANASPLTSLLPALLVLESLAALTLAWAIWHRLARARLGPPLARLSQFRFNDQLIWGLVVGATLVLLPSLDGWRGAGVNLVVVFGALFALRGLGVLLWWLPDRYAPVPLLVLVVCIPLLGPVLVLATVAVLALGLGLGDTWRDFRRTSRTWRPEARP